MSDDCALAVIAPDSVTDAVLLDTNVPESNYPTWVAETAYTKGQRVHTPANHTVYEAATDNTGMAPATNPNDWAKVGPTNRWAAFDGSISSQTANPGTIQYKLRFGYQVRWIQALNLKGAYSMRVEGVSDSAGDVFGKTVNLRPLPGGGGWWQWWFGRRFIPEQAAFSDLPGYPDMELTITITGGDDLAVGTLLFGTPEYFTLGVRMGANIGLQDYSRKERTEFGDVVLVPRAYARRANFTMVARAGEVDAIIQFMARVRATPCLWIGSDKYEATTIYGFYKSFDMTIEYDEYSIFSLELEGLT